MLVVLESAAEQPLVAVSTLLACVSGKRGSRALRALKASDGHNVHALVALVAEWRGRDAAFAHTLSGALRYDEGEVPCIILVDSGHMDARVRESGRGLFRVNI